MLTKPNECVLMHYYLSPAVSRLWKFPYAFFWREKNKHYICNSNNCPDLMRNYVKRRGKNDKKIIIINIMLCFDQHLCVHGNISESNVSLSHTGESSRSQLEKRGRALFCYTLTLQFKQMKRLVFTGRRPWWRIKAQQWTVKRLKENQTSGGRLLDTFAARWHRISWQELFSRCRKRLPWE